MLTQVPQARKMLGNQCSNECSGHEDEDEEDFHLWANRAYKSGPVHCCHSENAEMK